MNWFKKLSLGRFASRNKKDPIPADTGTERGASGYARVNPIPNNLPCSSQISDAATNGNRKCKHADKNNGSQWLLDVGGCIVCNQSSKDNRPIATRLGVVDSRAAAGNDVSSVEYGLKSIIALPVEHRNYNATSISTIINDDREDDLDLSEYVFVNEQDIGVFFEPQPKALDYLIQLGLKVEYGMTLEQVKPLESHKKSVKSDQPSSIAIQQIHLDVLEALNRSLMGPLYRSFQKTPDSESDTITTRTESESTSNTLQAACGMTREDNANVQAHFGLNDAGNIIIDVGHIEEQRGECLNYKKKYQKIFKKLEYADEVSEGTRFHLTWKQLVRKIMICLRCAAKGE